MDEPPDNSRLSSIYPRPDISKGALLLVNAGELTEKQAVPDLLHHLTKVVGNATKLTVLRSYCEHSHLVIELTNRSKAYSRRDSRMSRMVNQFSRIVSTKVVRDDCLKAQDGSRTCASAWKSLLRLIPDKELAHNHPRNHPFIAGGTVLLLLCSCVSNWSFLTCNYI